MNKKMSAVIIVLIVASAGLLIANVPNLIDFQGRITDSTDNPVNGPVGITFAVYEDSTGGAALWSETQNPVYVSNGLFHVFLGAVTPLPEDLFNESNRWIGIDVNSDGEMSPRTQIASVPYAKTDGDWTIDGDDMYSNNSGNVGIGETNPQAKLDVNGTVAFDRAYLNLDGQPTYTLDPVRSFYFIVPDQSGTGTSLTLENGTAQGQILFIVVSMYNSLTIIDNDNTRLNGDWEGYGNDMIMLVWAHAWVEISRSNND